MSNTHILRFASRACIVAGMVTLIVTGAQFSFARQMAQLTNRGAVVVPQNVELDAPVLHAAAFIEDRSAPFLIGALLVIAGLGFHALWISRQGGDRPVRVRAARPREKRPALREARAYWMYVQLK